MSPLFTFCVFLTIRRLPLEKVGSMLPERTFATPIPNGMGIGLPETSCAFIKYRLIPSISQKSPREILRKIPEFMRRQLTTTASIPDAASIMSQLPVCALSPVFGAFFKTLPVFFDHAWTKSADSSVPASSAASVCITTL